MSKAVLLLNLGSPDAPSVPAVRRFLREFLSDPRIIPLSYLFRKLLLELVILPFRAKKSAARYAKIWTEKGSPLIVEMQALRARLADALGENVPVYCAMRYGNPSVESVANPLLAAGTRELFIFPLYPQRAESSWDTAVEHASRIFSRRVPALKLHFAKPFFADSGYIAALAGSVEKALQGKTFEKLLISFHGVPVKTARSQNYREECETTGALLAQALSLPRERWEVVFQSRFGRGKWLEPSTATRLEALPAAGTTRLAVVAPGFTADCLETLEELGDEGRNLFFSAGGKDFFLVPCLNADSAFVAFLAETLQKDFLKTPN